MRATYPGHHLAAALEITDSIIAKTSRWAPRTWRTPGARFRCSIGSTQWRVRELRGRFGSIWDDLRREGELVITSNGKPIAILSPTEDDQVEDSLQAIRRARASMAVSRLQQRSVQTGRSKMSADGIQDEIAAARQGVRS